MSVFVDTDTVFQLNIAESRNVFRIVALHNGIVPADSVEHVVHGHSEAFLFDAGHENVFQIDVLHDPAASHGALKADSDVGIDKSAVLDEDIADAPGHLASDDESAVAHAYFAVMDQDILAGLPELSCFAVLAGLETDPVVSGLEIAVVDMDKPARFHIKTVAVLRVGGVFDPDIAYSQLLTEIRVQTPCRGILQGDAFDQNIPAVAQAHHHRPVEIVVGRSGCQRLFV